MHNYKLIILCMLQPSKLPRKGHQVPTCTEPSRTPTPRPQAQKQQIDAQCCPCRRPASWKMNSSSRLILKRLLVPSNVALQINLNRSTQATVTSSLMKSLEASTRSRVSIRAQPVTIPTSTLLAPSSMCT